MTRRRLGLLLLPAALLAAGALYQTTARAADQTRFPPPGRLIRLDERQFHLDCTGAARAGAATVILEGGLGAPALIWARVQPGLAEEMRVCSYDRAGYGWSDPAPGPRTARTLAAELHALLAVAGEPPPYLLVGHSLGALLTRVYAAEYPAEVAGLVWVDPRPIDMFAHLPPAARRIDERNLERARWLRTLTLFGVTRLAGPAGLLPELTAYLAPLPAEVKAAAWAVMIHNPQHWATAIAEREAITESYQQAAAAQLPTTLALTVLTAEHGAAAWRAPGDPADPAADAAWLDLQQAQARLTLRGQWQLVRDSGHYLYFDQPQAIIPAVLAQLRP